MKVTFADGTLTRAVCSENDNFDLDVGITICILKRLLGKNGHKIYNDLIRDAHKTLDLQAQEAERIRAEKIREAARRRKAEEKRKEKIAKAKRDYIELHKTAYIEAHDCVTSKSNAVKETPIDDWSDE